jgi:hypothetical protein
LIAEAKNTPLAEIVKVPDRARAKRVIEAMLSKLKRAVAELPKACNGC